MMRSVLVVLVLLGAGLTGCLGRDDAPAATDDVGQADTNVSDVPPDGREGKLVAFEETNSTEAGVGGVDHHHDMWGGESRKLFFERDAWMEPYPDDSNRAYAEFAPPGPGADPTKPAPLVFEGTSSVEFTISNPQRRVCPYGGTLDGEYVCSDFGTGARAPDPTGGPAGLKLRYQHSATIEWIDAGELSWGTPLSVKINNPRETDMPHATFSLWKFQVVSANPQDVTLTFDMKAEIVRGDANIPMWPGHPDFYSERSVREILNVPEAVSCDEGNLPLGCTSIDQSTIDLPAQKLISYGTKTLHVWVNISEANFPDPASKPQSWFLYHRNATQVDNTTNPFDTTTYSIEKREFYWAFPVDDNGMDSPYADGSRWSFRLGASLTTPAISCYENCATWNAKYSIVVLATNEVLPPEAYSWYCVRDADCEGAPDA